jgi:uncharacterized radical SAM superfamily Fe-S cluster-containing enzyme
MNGDVFLSATQSVCPECLQTLDALRLARGDDVILRKECPEHGVFEAILWRGGPSHDSWRRSKTPSYPKAPLTAVKEGCPHDCGLCPEHRQHTCTALIEVTMRCDLRCAYCFADGGNCSAADPDMEAIRSFFEKLLLIGGPCNVQLSGGEPTLRNDLPEIIRLGRSLGFDFIQVNTNGLRLARDPGYVKELKDAGAASVFLQFDGLDDAVYERLRGWALLQQKMRAVEHCADHGLAVVLVPTLTPGINDQQIGDIINYGLRNAPAVRGVHFQPISYFGRYPAAPKDEVRITIPEILRAIEEQTQGKIKADHFKPPGCEHSWCSFHGNFVLLEDGRLQAWTQHTPGASCCKPQSAEAHAVKARQFVKRFWATPKAVTAVSTPERVLPSLGGWDMFLERACTHSFCISGMAFQDAWNLDLERLKDCCIHVVHPDGRVIPFCAYNLTDSGGRALYRPKG